MPDGRVQGTIGSQMNAQPKQTDYQFRPMVAADLPQVYAVEIVAYDFPWTRGILADCIKVGYECWLLTDGRAILAYGIMSVAAGEAHILNLCVAPEYQGKGLGRRLLQHLLQVAQERRVDTVFLEVRQSNMRAAALYRSMQFNEVGFRKAYYPAERGREDAVIFARSLDLFADE